MANFLNIISDKEIYYFSIFSGKAALDEIPKSNWLLLAISDSPEDIQYNWVNEAFERNVLYVCSTGKNRSGLDIICDTQRANRNLNKNTINSDPTTTEHENIEKALWFAVNVAWHHNSLPIRKIVIFDFSKGGYAKEVIEAIDKLKIGWDPE